METFRSTPMGIVFEMIRSSRPTLVDGSLNGTVVHKAPKILYIEIIRCSLIITVLFNGNSSAVSKIPTKY